MSLKISRALYVAVWALILTGSRLAIANDSLTGVAQDGVLDHSHYAYVLAVIGLIIFGLVAAAYALRAINRRRAQQLLTEREHRIAHDKYVASFESAPVPMALIRLDDGAFIDANQTFFDYIRRSKDEVIGKRGGDFGLWAYDEDRDLVMQVIQARKPVSGQFVTLCRSDGSTVRCQYWARLIEVDSKECFLAVIQDLSDIEAAHGERLALEAQVRQLQKLESLGTLAGGIAHDFNNILGISIGYTALARDKLSDDPVAARGFLDEVLKAADRAKDLVGQILTFSRQGRPEQTLLKLEECVDEVVSLLRASLPPSLIIESSIETDDSTILANATQMQQVILNLCANAAHALSNSGTLRIALARVDSEENIVTTTAPLGAGSYYRVSVTDEGPGIHPQVLPRIFDPFFTTKNVGEGTGLGLSVVHGIVAGFGGAIDVSSEASVMTRFDVYLPVCEQSAPVSDTMEHGLGMGKGEHILFVDDEQGLVRLSCVTLDSLGYRTVGFCDPRDALDVLSARTQDFSLLITDLAMPHMDGLTLIREVQSRRPGLPVIVITGTVTDSLRHALSAAGANEVLLKPVSREQLALSVERALAAGAVRDDLRDADEATASPADPEPVLAKVEGVG